MLLDTPSLPVLLAENGIDATFGSAFANEIVPLGLRTIRGHRPACGAPEPLSCH
jgi:hypothetical protein